ncbi:hypothetical protein I302_100062 [Kwoniella bestiolae CBS 10118]|uniref:Uncharacterized protein n=1 Tax=Kwoniella bestiolae CBS 10118 TaxID=1296100 RepID=A0A1B9G424_9TREE|nr:hypothetical protein I302_03434 [Kwoniella bestiolae CBS 10118]OCF25761.1 hypothetical protein I302_03434 [Kwoniella bestiolae CBS 10118]
MTLLSFIRSCVSGATKNSTLEDMKSKNDQLAQDLNATKAQIRAMLSSFEECSRFQKTYQEVTEENDRLRRRCALLESQIKDLTSPSSPSKYARDATKGSSTLSSEQMILELFK